MRSTDDLNAGCTPFENTHWSYTRLKALLNEYTEEPLDSVVIVEQERPGCTSEVTEDVAAFYREIVKNNEKPQPAGLTTDGISLRTVHYVDIEPED